MRAVVVSEVGGPEVLRLEEIDGAKPGTGEALVRIEAAGVNFIDIYHRSGQYPADVPFVPGMEGAGVVEAIGPGVSEARPGDRVAWVMHRGSYAERAVVPAARLVPIPAGLETQRAVAAMLQGMTAHYLAHSTFPLGPSHTAVVHAAAGGVGRLLVQMAKRAGARVIGTVSTAAKASLALEAGADHAVIHGEADFRDEARRLTSGRGADVVYDSIGRDTFERGLACLRPRGLMVLYGQSSGAVEPTDLQVLAAHGSLFLTRPSLAHYVATRDELLTRSRTVLSWVLSGEIDVRIDRVLPLEKAAEAHRHLEGRRSTGKLLLAP